uniref:Predicted protein n=1 Tax=Physcomitrium patens TaxID=3218 RepID=A9U835_PHYPA
MIRNIPLFALLPLFIIWFGIGEEIKLALVSLGVFFPVYLNTFHGIRSVDPGLIEMGKVYRMSRRSLYAHIVLPGALPSILVGVRYALGITWLVLIVAETVAADAGIGYMAMNAREFFQLDVIVLSIVIYALLGKLSDSLAKRLEKRKERNRLRAPPARNVVRRKAGPVGAEPVGEIRRVRSGRRKERLRQEHAAPACRGASAAFAGRDRLGGGARLRHAGIYPRPVPGSKAAPLEVRARQRQARGRHGPGYGRGRPSPSRPRFPRERLALRFRTTLYYCNTVSYGMICYLEIY